MKNKVTKIFLLLSLLTLPGLLFQSCGTEVKDLPPPDSGNKIIVTPEFKKLSPEFSSDSAYIYIEKQLSFGARVPNTDAHKKCGDWLVNKLKEFTPIVIVPPGEISGHDGTKYSIRNIIAEFNPENKKRILITAHWDSRAFADNDKDNKKHKMPVPAANDGASGVGIIIEIARQLKLKAPAIGIDLIFWDVEDQGKSEIENSFCLGSQYWANHKHKEGYKPVYGVNLDMVGAENPRFGLEDISFKSAQTYLNNIWKIAGNLGYGAMFVWDKDSGVIDDHYYVANSGIPMIEIIDRTARGDFFPHWHTTTDDLDKISKKSLKAVGQTLLEVIYREF